MMHIQPECLPCLVRQAVDMVRRSIPEGDDAERESVLRRALAVLADTPFQLSPPSAAARVQAAIAAMTGVADPYLTEKQQGNDNALRALPVLRERMAAAPDPFEAAVRLSVAGNIIDFGIPDLLDRHGVDATLDQALHVPLDVGAVAELRAACDAAEHILFLADNAGEIVLDRLLIELLPLERVTVAVKSGPALNDATREDAEIAGLPRLCRVIETGGCHPGTILDQLSPAFRAAYARADLILSKGQANVETLPRDDPRIFFLLKVKCPIVASMLDADLGTALVRRGGAPSVAV